MPLRLVLGFALLVAGVYGAVTTVNAFNASVAAFTDQLQEMRYAR